MSQDGTGLEGLVICGAKNGAAWGGSVFYLLFRGAKWEGGRGPHAHTHTHTHGVSADRKRKCLAFSSRLSPGQA